MSALDDFNLSYLPIQFQKELAEDYLTGIVNPKIELEHTIRGMIYRLKAYVLTDHLEPYTITVPKTVTIQVPATWWDDFKLTYAHKWWMPLRTLKTVKFRTLKIETSVTIVVDPQYMFPHADPPYPRDFGKPFKVTTWRNK